MPERPGSTDESVLIRWMRLELDRINAGIVVERKTLARLLREEHPAAKTKGGSVHTFDRNVLEHLGRRLPGILQEKLLLPILFHADMEVRGSVALTDSYAVHALQELGEISALRTIRNGKLWIARPIAYLLARKYPTAVQVMMG